MKKFLLIISALFYLSTGSAQSVTRLIGSSPFQDSIWVFDTLNFNVIRRAGPSIPGFTITGMTGLTRHPLTNENFIICKLSGVSGRVLGKLDPLTMIVTQVGNLGDNFSSITFASNGTMYGATGNGATVPETLYKINTSDASKTLITAMGAGADGEVICYNPTDDMIYHWSGNGTPFFEKIDTLGSVITNIPLIGTTNGEVFGAVHVTGGQFLISNINSRFQRWYADGTVAPPHGNSTPDDIRGTAFITCPRLITGTAAYCVGGSTTLTMNGTGSYQWFKNGTLLSGETNQSLNVNSTGFYNCIISDACGTDSLAAGVNVIENALPIVNVTGNPNLCPNSTNILTGTGGGTRQWYLNGVAIPGATSVTYSASLPGVYNMIKTNTNLCADSAAIGVTVISVAAPTVGIGNDTSICMGDSLILDAQNSGNVYLWNDNSTNQTLTVSAGGSYYVVVTNNNNCSTNDTINITLNNLPIVNLGDRKSVV